MVYNIYCQTSRKRTDISVLLSCQRNMDCTGRTIADAFIPGRKQKRDSDRMQKKHRYASEMHKKSDEGLFKVLIVC